MTQILHIASSSNLESSATRQIGSLAVEQLRQADPAVAVIERDLVRQPIPHLSPETLKGFGTPGSPEAALSESLVEELLASDVLVIEAPMYNFNIPSVLKAWIDHVVRAGRTFTYSSAGPEGLAKGKSAILILGRGGVYSSGPASAMDHQESYLRAVLGFIGISDVQTIYIEGMGMGPERVALALAGARERVAQLTAAAA